MLLTPPRFQTFDLSGVTYLNYGEIMNIRNSFNLFESVQVCNIRVSTSLGLGTTSFVSGSSENNGLFYQFQSNAALISFKAGQQYHVTRYPYIDFSTLVQIPAPPGPGPTDLLDSCLCNAIGSVPDSSSEYQGGITALTNYVFNSTMMATKPGAKRYFRSFQDYVSNRKACAALFQTT